MIEEKLNTLGVKMPVPPKPAGSYVPVTISKGFAFVSGQIPMEGGKLIYKGKVSDENLETAQKSALLCTLNILAQLKLELGSLDKVAKIVRLNGFVNSNPDFFNHPKVINAASDFLFELFGEKGKHSRVAVGVNSLPLDSMTEIDTVVELS